MSNSCAIIGMGLITALGASVNETWEQMMNKTCGIRPMARVPHGKYKTDVTAEIPADIEALLLMREPLPEERRASLWALCAARAALRDAFERLPSLEKSRIGLVLTTTKGDFAELENSLSDSKNAGAEYILSRMARDLAKRLSLSGPVLAVSNACASGLIAMVQAARLLNRRQADAMLVVGVDALSEFVIAGFSCLGALSNKPCRPYDSSRDGLTLGEAAGAIILLSDDKNGCMHGRIRGWGVNSDANHITAPSRTGEGLKLAIRSALNMASMAPDEIHYINGHGTATIYNDEMESHAMVSVFGPEGPPLSSMKGYFGHTLGAAGIIEAILSLKAIRELIAPASLGLECLGVSQPINAVKEHIEMRRMANVLTVKSGFGGINAAVVLSK